MHNEGKSGLLAPASGAGRDCASAASARAATSARSPLALDLASSAVISNGPPKTLPCLLDPFGSRENGLSQRLTERGRRLLHGAHGRCG